MRHIFALFLTSTMIFASCQQDSNNYTLKGEAVGFADGAQVLVFAFENKQPKAIDTLIIKDGKFSGTYPKSNILSLNFLRVEGVNGTVLYFPESEDLKATVYKDSMQGARVVGGDQNKAYNDFATGIAKFNEKKQEAISQFRTAQENQDTTTLAQLQSENLNLMNEENEYKKQFLKDHKNSLFAVMLLSEMVSRQEVTPDEATKHLEGIDSKVAASEITQELKTGLETMRKADVGVKAPDFSAPTPEGGTLALSETLGKYTIIDFWASWCRPCRVENPNVVKVYNKYHEKGLNIISVSLDKAEQRDKWLQAIIDDQMDWYHVSNLQFWNDPIAQEYSVRSIPATFLLDENGIIIDKDLRGAALEAKMATLFAEK